MSKRFKLDHVTTMDDIKKIHAKRMATKSEATTATISKEAIDEAYALGKVDGGEALIDKVASMTAAMASIDQHGQMIGVMVSCTPETRQQLTGILMRTCEVINAMETASAVIVD